MGHCLEGTCGDSGCCGEKQHSGCSSSGCDTTDMLMQLAEDAWAGLMKEKIKKAYEAKIGKQMDKTAEAAAQAAIDYWQWKMQGKAGCEQAKESIKKTMMG